MLKLVIVSLLVLAVQSAWWWPFPRKKESSNVPFVYYNETTGVETVITKNFIQELNPFAYSLLKLIITGIKLPLPPQKLAKGVTVYIEHATCQQIKFTRDEQAPGLYLGDGFIGLGVKFDAKCRAWFQTTTPGKPGLLHGWFSLTLTGVNGNAHVTLNYDNHDQHIEPTIIEPFELKFKSVDIKLDNSYAINGLTSVLKVIFPKVASSLFKKSISSTVHSMASQLKTMDFGSKKHYHPIFLYPPVINPEKIKLNLALVEWKMKNAAINDDGALEADDSEDEEDSDEEEYYFKEDGEKEYLDAVQDLLGLPVD